MHVQMMQQGFLAVPRAVLGPQLVLVGPLHHGCLATRLAGSAGHGEGTYYTLLHL